MLMKPYTYIFIRSDIPTEYQIVQASHAALEAGNEFAQSEETSFMVLLGAKSETKLKNIAEYLGIHDIKFKMFHEPDYGTGYTAICTEQIFGEQRKIFKKFNTLKHK